MIVFCQVHAKCYGELEPVDGVLWLCNLCRPGAPNIPPPCCLCPLIGSLVPNNKRNNICLSPFLFCFHFFCCANVPKFWMEHFLHRWIKNRFLFTRGCYEAYNRWTLGSPCLCNMDTRLDFKCICTFFFLLLLDVVPYLLTGLRCFRNMLIWYQENGADWRPE